MNRPDESPDTLALLENAAWIRRLARWLLEDAHLAEDVAQDVLVAALERRPAVSVSPARLRRWLGGVTRHLASRARRREGERANREARAARPEALDEDEAPSDRLRLHRRLVEAVLALDEPHRSAVVLRFFDDLTPREIARRQGVTSDVIRQRLSRALAKLRCTLDREFEGGRAIWSAALLGLIDAGAPAALPAALSKAGLAAAVSGLAALALIVAILISQAGGERGPDESSRGPTAAVERTAPPPVAADAAKSPAPSEDETRKPVEAGASAADVPLEVRLLTIDGGALEGAEVFILSGNELREVRSTDAEGSAMFAGRDAGGFLVASVPKRPPAVRAVDALRGSYEMVLTSGSALSGWLTEDGEAPGEPVILRLRSLGDPLAALDEGLRDLLAGRGVAGGRLEVVTGAAGAFRIEGLPSDWSGRLGLPATHWFVEAPPEGSLEESGGWLSLRQAAEGLALRTTRLPSVRGRIVCAETGEPLGNVGVMVWAQFTDGTQTPQSGSRADAEGRFIRGLFPTSSDRHLSWRESSARPAIQRVRVIADAGGGHLGRELRFSTGDIGPDGDLGDIPLERGADLHFLVVDEAGQPIEGALVVAGALSEPTDAAGRTLLRGIHPAVDSVLVGSPFHQIQSFPPSGRGRSPEDPARIVLQAGNRLELVLVSAGGLGTASMRVTFECVQALFEGDKPWTSTWLHRRFATGEFDSATWGDWGGRLEYRADAQGCVTLVSLRPDAILDVEVQGAMERPILRRRLRGPASGQTLRHELAVEAWPFDLQVRVRDEVGQPLAGVRLYLRDDDGWISAATGSDGYATFEDLLASPGRARLEASLAGYAPVLVEGLNLAPDARLPDLVLQRGLEVRVRVVDEAGAPIPVSAVTARAPGHPPMRSQHLESGVEVLRDLPPGRVLLEAEYGFRLYSQEHDALIPEATITLPVHGTLELLASVEALQLEEDRPVARIPSLDGPEGPADLSFRIDGDLGVATTPLIPGRYRIHLERIRWFEGERRPERLEGDWEVEIGPGRTTVLRLGD